MLKVDGVELPMPTTYAPDFEEISKAERNAKGKMIKEVVAYKYKLNLTWKMLNSTEMAKLVNVKKKNSFAVEFVGMEGKKVNGEFYAGTPSATAMQYKNGKVEYWLDVKMNLIEM